MVKRPASLVVFIVAEIGVVFAVGAIEGSDLSTDAVALAVACLLGDATRRRREVLELHRERADQPERTQEEATRRAVAEEASGSLATSTTSWPTA